MPGLAFALGKTNVLKHKIKLKPETQPIYIPAYRMPHSRLATLDKIIAEMLTQDAIQSSDSKWNFPLILVPKPAGTFRSVVDYRKMKEPFRIGFLHQSYQISFTA